LQQAYGNRNGDLSNAAKVIEEALRSHLTLCRQLWGRVEQAKLLTDLTNGAGDLTCGVDGAGDVIEEALRADLALRLGRSHTLRQLGPRLQQAYGNRNGDLSDAAKVIEEALRSDLALQLRRSHTLRQLGRGVEQAELLTELPDRVGDLTSGIDGAGDVIEETLRPDLTLCRQLWDRNSTLRQLGPRLQQAHGDGNSHLSNATKVIEEALRPNLALCRQLWGRVEQTELVSDLTGSAGDLTGSVDGAGEIIEKALRSDLTLQRGRRQALRQLGPRLQQAHSDGNSHLSNAAEIVEEALRPNLALQLRWRKGDGVWHFDLL
jgi:hypothetical protein